jgi:quercetin dioxygenase-like cupin family protein
MGDQSRVRPFREGFRWKDVESRAYKEDGAAVFRDITRQTLFATDQLSCELRYFEMEPNGHSTLECHQHVHAVMILRGRGEVLVGHAVQAAETYDLVTIPSMTWHQFRATRGEPFGFLCMVNADRDRPRVPTEAEIQALRSTPTVAAFLDQV